MYFNFSYYCKICKIIQVEVYPILYMVNDELQDCGAEELEH